MQRMLLFATLLSLLLTYACGSGNGNDTPAKQAEITFDKDAITFAYKAASGSVAVTADADWGVSSSADWCSVSPSGGVAGTTKLKITVAENKTGEKRTTQLTVKSASTYKYIDVLQNYEVVEVSIGDEAFKRCLLASYDTDGDGVLSTVEAASVTSINASGCGIKALAELSVFAALTSLDCSNNALEQLDLSGVTKLTTLNCANNRLSTLDVRLNQSIETLDCTGNPLTEVLVWTGFTAPSGWSVPQGAKYTEPEIDTPQGYRLIWQEEFNAAGHSLPDSKKWWYETGNNGWGNNEIQNYVAGRSGSDTVALVSEGTLKIVAKKSGNEVLSTRMNTSQGWTYGWFEARLKLPKGKGTWPAFWMMPKNFTAWPDDGEIDIMEEVGYNPNYVSSSIHCKAYYHKIGTQKTAQKFVATAQSEFHVYALEWTADYIYGYIDGARYFTFANDHTGNHDTWPFMAPFYLKLNLAWGGDWGGAQGLDQNALPATFEVDYVRVFQKID